MKQLLVILGICSLLAACANANKFPATASPRPAAAAVNPSAEPVATLKKSEAPLPENSIYCKRDLDERVITIKERDPRVPAQSKDDLLCEVLYDKYGKSERVAWASGSKTYCDEVRGRIQANLESAGFKCSKDAPKPAEKKAQLTKTKTV